MQEEVQEDVQVEDGPGTDSSWTPWKLLHHQTQDLSPWLTEGVAVENLQESPRERSVAPSMMLEEEIRVSPWRRHWRVYAIIAVVIWFVPRSERHRIVSKLERLWILTCR